MIQTWTLSQHSVFQESPLYTRRSCCSWFLHWSIQVWSRDTMIQQLLCTEASHWVHHCLLEWSWEVEQMNHCHHHQCCPQLVCCREEPGSYDCSCGPGGRTWCLEDTDTCRLCRGWDTGRMMCRTWGQPTHLDLDTGTWRWPLTMRGWWWWETMMVSWWVVEQDCVVVISVSAWEMMTMYDQGLVRHWKQ